MPRIFSRSFSRSASWGVAAALATLLLTTQATAGSLLPRLRLPKINLVPKVNLVPKINMGKAVAAVAYPVTKAAVNGGKTVLQTAATAEVLGVLPSVGPPAVNSAVKKIVITIVRH